MRSWTTLRVCSRQRIRTTVLGQTIRNASSSIETRLCSQLPTRGVLSVSGTDSKTFLNGIIASSIRDYPFYTAFLSAQGRVLYDVFIYPYTTDGRPGFLIDFDSRASEATPLLSSLKRHVLRSKVRIRDVSEEWKVWSIWGDSAQDIGTSSREWRWGRSGAAEPLYLEGEHRLGSEYAQDVIGTKDLRAPGMGDRLLIRTGDKPETSATWDLARDESQYLLHRIASGVPEGQEDIVPQHAFPMDSNMDLMGGIDFRKGCYVGQELTVRTYHTGVIRKRIMPVSITPAPSQKSGDASVPDVSLPLHAAIQAERLANSTSDAAARPTRPRGTGTLLSNVNGLGLALLRSEHVEGVERGDLAMSLSLEGDGGSSKLSIQPRRPSWWPSPPDNSETT
ncbi:Aminomethyltransferase folate-binding domain-containing protein [Ceratobasidium sp. AG-I]|nr:Aminomethyltransferase folate-binding domain-containing protein [Ceratobasidium sp. AG-I]